MFSSRPIPISFIESFDSLITLWVIRSIVGGTGGVSSCLKGVRSLAWLLGPELISQWMLPLISQRFVRWMAAVKFSVAAEFRLTELFANLDRRYLTSNWSWKFWNSRRLILQMLNSVPLYGMVGKHFLLIWKECLNVLVVLSKLRKIVQDHFVFFRWNSNSILFLYWKVPLPV